eukprot:CAMPEP_0201986796 /NCGR_PEP_ID=MMETSP0904-20121228/91460_1 /ASSEMBLY_ACC=CAM_ASM_000553 /TAXON_ID=420261 /ORGANISM="Thalassiosira antarctica, Strain CCMP982" /LENGTH=468 /DNA_ID=CAMNT_0048540873 /DNA_START=210 /DNA_END=1617 /DNA_ORIENTATION=-
MEYLVPAVAEWRDGHGKALGIIVSTSAIVSAASSSILIWMILKSRARLSITYHRLVLGMSIADILLSLSFAQFNAMAPSDMSYAVWNARGSQATCSAQGFVAIVGTCSGLLYSCSVNLYYLAIVKYNKSDRYIRTKIEPFLHGVPIVFALIYSITLLVNQNLNTSMAGSCVVPVYDPPHCIGYEDGQVREGFEIPCGRGRDGAPTFALVYFFILTFGTPIVIGTSLGMLYRDLSKQEKRMARYGGGAFNPSATQQTTDSAAATDVNRSSGLSSSISSVISSVRRTFGRGSSSNSNQEHSNSRGVMHRALAYSIAYFLTWSWAISNGILMVAGVPIPLALAYLSMIFSPLQGLFTLIIFMQPKVMRIVYLNHLHATKSDECQKIKGGNLSWCEAIAKAFWPAGTVGKRNTPDRGTGGKKNTLDTAVRKSSEIEEEKTEIQAHQQGSNDLETSHPTYVAHGANEILDEGN